MMVSDAYSETRERGRALCKAGSGGVGKMDKNAPIGQQINKIGQACETRVAVSLSVSRPRAKS